MSVSSGSGSLCSSVDGEDEVVTEEWMTAVLAAYHDLPSGQVTVTSLTLRPGCDQAENVLSDILAVSVDYTAGPHPHHLHLIVKLLPRDPFSRYFVTEAQFDLREIKFYTRVNTPFLENKVTLLTMCLLPHAISPVAHCVNKSRPTFFFIQTFVLVNV